ncbi:hypothetical protein Tco_0323659 [Tanacetum coccineum]
MRKTAKVIRQVLYGVKKGRKKGDLDKFEGVDFIRWQKKMHFLLSSMSVVYVLTTSILEDGGDDATVEQIRKRNKWDNDDYVCKGLIFKVATASLYNPDAVKSSRAFLSRLRSDAVSNILTSSLADPDGIARIPNVVSTHSQEKPRSLKEKEAILEGQEHQEFFKAFKPYFL